jgi:type VI secretion system protein ImpG
MGDDLLPYFNKELAFLQALLDTQFRENNPKIATRLGLGPASIKDPHVQRLVEGIAYLNARVRCKLDDEFPELTHALLEVLYPHYLAPIPSMAIAQFGAKSNTPVGYEIGRHAYLDTGPEPTTGEPCTYRTCYPVRLWPIEVENAGVCGRPLPAPKVPHGERAEAIVRIALRCTRDDASFAALAPGTLRFFLVRPEQYTFSLYDLLLNDPLQVAVARGSNDPAPVILGPGSLRAVGFSVDDAILPYDPRAFPGYRLLTEFFAFPTKFLFFEVTGLDEQRLSAFSDRLEIYVYTREGNRDLEHSVTAETFALGCTPMVNLFPLVAEPIPVTHEQFEYEVAPERRRRGIEVYSVDRVFSMDEQGQTASYLPFYGAHHAEATDEAHRFWHATRRVARYHPGTEIFLSFTDLDFDPAELPAEVVSVETTCLNRDLPNNLPYGGGQPVLTLRQGGAPVSILCLTPPTPTLRPVLRQGAWWRLISHLSLNHLSITDPQEGTRALREILKLYDFKDSAETRAMIEGIVRVESQLAPGRLDTAGSASFCQGTAVRLQLDESRFPASNQFLFASVLERFLALYCSINSFTQLTATVRGGERVLHRWPPRAGDQLLL